MEQTKQKLDPLYYGCDVRDIAQDFYDWGIRTLEDITKQIEADGDGIQIIPPEEIYSRVLDIINCDDVAVGAATRDAFSDPFED